MARLSHLTQELAPQLREYQSLIAYAQMIGNALDDPNDVNPEDLAATYEVLPDVHLAIPDGLASNRKSTKSTFPTLQEFEFEVATIEFEEAFAKQVQTDPEPFVAEIPSIQLYPFLYQVAKIRVTESKETKGILGIGAKSKQKKIEIVKSPREGRQFVEQIAEDLMLEMVYVPSGDYVMGAPDKEESSYAHERPQHLVTVSAFLMGKYPITQAQYESVMGKNPSRFKDKPDSPSRPVENVSWEDAQEFCKKLSELSGREYHLPSEAQWEYACRAMPSPPISRNEKEIIYPPFHFGETILTKVANYNGDKIYGRGEKGESQGETTAVDHFGVANEFGLCDMHGNVWEWCEDDWHSNYDGAPTDGSAWIDAKSKESNKTSHPLRGGSWIVNPEFCRSAFRNGFNLVNRNVYVGFRVISFAPGLT
jgi:formylglycine-generating enzyme required for sulfatase activity